MADGADPARSLTKTKLRSSALARARLRPAALIAGASRRIAGLLAESAEWRAADFVFCYAALPTEVQTEAIILRARSEGRAVGLPRVEGTRLEFHLAPETAAGYETGSLGVRQPRRESPRLEPPPGGRLLVLAPGLLFDRAGSRLGRGGGHYDRFLARARERWDTICVGLCFEEQVVAFLPRDPWDQRVDGLVSEASGLWRCLDPPAGPPGPGGPAGAAP